MSGLAAYLDDKREAVRAARATVEAGAATPRRLEANVTVEGRSGVRRTRIRDHQFLTDSSVATGGFDLGPSPVETLLGALGGCLAHTILIQAATRQLPLDELTITVSATADPRAGHPAHPDIPVYPRDISYEVRITSAADEASVQRAVDAAEQICPITALLTQPQPVTGTLVFTPADRLAADRLAAAPPALTAVAAAN